jgi:hypothetical protein
VLDEKIPLEFMQANGLKFISLEIASAAAL